MHARFLALLLAILVAAAALSGCAGRGQENVQPGGDITPSTTPPTTVAATPGPLSRFVVDTLEVLAPDGTNRSLYEDDANATVRYVVRQPDDAPTETAFVTYLLNGRIVDVQNVKLAPGESKTWTREVDLRGVESFRVEVRASASIKKAEASVQTWPRAGETLALGPLNVRLDYGLMEQDGRVLVNATLEHTGPEAPLRDFRIKMLCLDAQGKVVSTPSARAQDVPPYGETSGVDVVVDDCPVERYGLEFKADGDAGVTYYGRILLVAKGWTPPQA